MAIAPLTRYFCRMTVLCASLIPPCIAAQTVTVYTSANFAPLMLGDGRGVYPDLIGYLNRHKPGGLTFRLQFVPRKRLQVKVEEGSIEGVVIGMMPQWFNDAEQTKYLWTAPFAQDRFVLVTQAAGGVRPENPASLKGATVGLVLGYVYPGVDNWIRQRGMVRDFASSEETSLEKVIRGRTKSAVVAESMVRYYIKSHNLGEKLRINAIPGTSGSTERRFLIPHSQREVYDKLAPAIRRMKDDPTWQELVSRYE